MINKSSRKLQRKEIQRKEKEDIIKIREHIPNIKDTRF